MSSYNGGYSDTQFMSPRPGTRERKAAYVSSTSSKVAMPVDRIIGRPRSAMRSNEGMSVSSPDPILNDVMPISASSTAAAYENGVHMYVMPISPQ